MTVKKIPTEQKLEFALQSTAVSECTDDAWTGDDVESLDEDVIAEMQKDDEKPFHVEFVALYEGMSNNQRVYSKDAVKSCVDAMVGVNMYKGHIEPGSQSWKYRDPVGKVVSAKLAKVKIDGKEVLAAKGRAYITDADPKLRSDIKKKMAGNVSILGNARMVRQYGEKHKTVTRLHKPLKSVDFCNPGTGGLSQAGVTAVVSEMDAKEGETQTEPQDHEVTEMSKKLTKDELLAEYGTEVTELVGEQIGEQVKANATAKRELAEEKEKFVDEKKALEGEVAEMKTKVEASEKDASDWKAKFEQERDKRIEADVAVFATEHVAEMKGLEGANEKLIDLAAKRCKATVVDGDLDKSKTAYKDAIKGAMEEVSELAEMFGGEPSTDVSNKPTKKVANNKKGGKGKDASAFMSPELKKAHKERVGA